MASLAVDTVDDLHHRFSHLGLVVIEGSKKREDALKLALEGSDFTIFTVVKDLGYWGWTPSGSYKAMDQVTAKEILDQLNVDKTPDQLSPLPLIKRSLPKKFASLPPQKHINKYPFAAPILASLYVSIHHRGVDLDKEVDYLFGGSTLEMLSHLSIEPGYQYLVTRVPEHPNTVYVSCFTEYEQDCNHAGFQFERLMTGRQFTDPPDKCQVKHSHILQVGESRVLFTAEVDGAHNGECVEIKTSNPRHWKTRIMFQMMSNGSTIMCSGHKMGDVLKNVQLKNLSKVIRDALSDSNVQELERNICNGIHMLKREVAAKLKDDIMELYFDRVGASQVLKFRPINGKVLFPSESTNKVLLG
jgi:hypothetical protein